MAPVSVSIAWIGHQSWAAYVHRGRSNASHNAPGPKRIRCSMTASYTKQPFCGESQLLAPFSFFDGLIAHMHMYFPTNAVYYTHTHTRLHTCTHVYTRGRAVGYTRECLCVFANACVCICVCGCCVAHVCVHLVYTIAVPYPVANLMQKSSCASCKN